MAPLITNLTNCALCATDPFEYFKQVVDVTASGKATCFLVLTQYVLRSEPMHDAGKPPWVIQSVRRSATRHAEALALE